CIRDDLVTGVQTCALPICRQQQVLLAIRQKAKQLSPEDIPALAQAIGGEIKTSIPLSRVAALLPLASSFDNPDAIRTIVLPSPRSEESRVGEECRCTGTLR